MVLVILLLKCRQSRSDISWKGDACEFTSLLIHKAVARVSIAGYFCGRTSLWWRRWGRKRHSHLHGGWKVSCVQNRCRVQCLCVNRSCHLCELALVFPSLIRPSNDSFDRASKILSHMGKNLVHCGDVGTGDYKKPQSTVWSKMSKWHIHFFGIAGGVAKLCNNLVLAISMIGVSEVFRLLQFF